MAPTRPSPLPEQRPVGADISLRSGLSWGAFDDLHAVAGARLLLSGTLAQHLGLPEVIERTVDHGQRLRSVAHDSEQAGALPRYRLMRLPDHGPEPEAVVGDLDLAQRFASPGSTRQTWPGQVPASALLAPGSTRSIAPGPTALPSGTIARTCGGPRGRQCGQEQGESAACQDWPNLGEKDA